MQLTKTQETLEAFKNFVIQQARTRLTKGNKNVSNELYNSLKGNVKAMANSISVEFEMEEYGIYQDQGVNPIGKKIYDTPYQYKRFPSFNGAFAKSMAKWAKQKNIRLRDSKGRFTKGNYQTIGYILAKRIATGQNKNKGIKPSLFFTKPFEQAFKKLPNELVENFGLDIEDFLAFTLKEDRLKK
jgi:hypothetical protein